MRGPNFPSTFEELADAVEFLCGLDARVLLEIVGQHPVPIRLSEICDRFNSNPQRAIAGLVQIGGHIVSCEWDDYENDIVTWSLDPDVPRPLHQSAEDYVHGLAPGVR